MRLIVVVVLFLPILAIAQDFRTTSQAKLTTQEYLDLYSASDFSHNRSHDEFFGFIDKAESKRSMFRDDQAFIQHLFVKAHQKFLRDYEQYATFGQLFVKGKYNCLTGTAVYALLLDHFNIDYSITETNYHIFLTAKTSSGNVLIEATDPTQGFVTDPALIEKRIQAYRQNENAVAERGKKNYYYSFSLYNEVTLLQLAGLLHYNIAIGNYNDHEFGHAINHLDSALALYDSPRIEEFSRVLLLTVAESGLDKTMKELYMKKVQTIRKKRLMMMASAQAN
jgi:hypothetical protein